MILQIAVNGAQIIFKMLKINVNFVHTVWFHGEYLCSLPEGWDQL